MTDERFSKEQAEIDQAAAAAPPPPRRTEPRRKYVEQPTVSADEIETFIAEELESK